MVSGCERFYWVESGNDCFDIAQEANVNLTSFYAWNVRPPLTQKFPFSKKKRKLKGRKLTS